MLQGVARRLDVCGGVEGVSRCFKGFFQCVSGLFQRVFDCVSLVLQGVSGCLGVLRTV